MSAQTVARKKKKAFIIAGGIAAILVLVLVAVRFLPDLHVRYAPDFERINLESYLEKIEGPLSEEDYQMLLAQTGLGAPAVDKILASESAPGQVLTAYQDDIFNVENYVCEQIGIITYEERLRDEERALVWGFQLADVQNGDILVSKSTHSIGWRHGHAAIVTDAEKGETLEAAIWGQPTMFRKVSYWRTYPTFIQLRLKAKALRGREGLGDELAAFASETLYDVNYGLLTGFPFKSRDRFSTTQCAHLPWYVYAHFGYDLDSDGGWLVTPRDIVNCSDLEIVQIYGVSPDTLW